MTKYKEKKSVTFSLVEMKGSIKNYLKVMRYDKHLMIAVVSIEIMRF